MIKDALTRATGKPVILIKGAGEMASGIACRLHSSGFKKILMLDTHYPLAVRRTVSFCEAIHDTCVTVEGVRAVRAEDRGAILDAWRENSIAVAADPEWTLLPEISPDIVIDAVLAKKNLGTTMTDAALTIGCGPGFTAGRDVHRVVETQRGHDLGRVIEKGSAIPNTGIPGNIGGYTVERVLRAPVDGIFMATKKISDRVDKGDVVARVGNHAVKCAVSGILRGLIRDGVRVPRGLKIGDVDPRAETGHCFTVSDKARAIGGGVLEAVLR